MKSSATALSLACVVFVAGCLFASAHSSAVKGAVKGGQQHVERQAKSTAPVGGQAPQLESSKKVYNDESLRRSPAVLEQVAPAPQSVAAPAPVAAAVPQKSVVVPVVGEPVVQVQPVVPAVAAPVAATQPAAVVVAAPEQPVKEAAAGAAPVIEAKSEPVVEKIEKRPAVEKVVELKKDDLPPQSDRSAPIKDEAPIKPAAVVEAPKSVVVVEQVVPAKSAPVEPVALVAPVVAPVVPVAPVEAVAAPAKQAEEQLQAKKDEPIVAKKDDVAQAEPLHIEVPAPDPQLVLSEPIDSTTKLLIDLDEHVQKFLPAEDKQEPAVPAKDAALVSGVDYSPASNAAAVDSPVAVPVQGKSGVLVPYSSGEQDPIVPPLPVGSLEKVEKASGGGAVAAAASSAAAASGSAGSPPSSGAPATRQAGHSPHNQQQVITQLLDQLDSLQNRIQDTINQLVARRRYVMSALLRPMGTYVRRVRSNLERLQNRVNQLASAAQSGGNGQRPGGFVDAAAIETIRRRIDDISKRISDIVNRIRFSLTPTSAPLNSNGRR